MFWFWAVCDSSFLFCIEYFCLVALIFCCSTCLTVTKLLLPSFYKFYVQFLKFHVKNHEILDEGLKIVFSIINYVYLHIYYIIKILSKSIDKNSKKEYYI